MLVIISFALKSKICESYHYLLVVQGELLRYVKQQPGKGEQIN